MRATSIPITTGAIVTINGEIHVVKRFETSDSVVVTHIRTRTDRIVFFDEISESLAKEPSPPQRDLHVLTQTEAWGELVERFEKLLPLVAMQSRSRADVEAVADEEGVSTATMYRWLDRLERYGTISCLMRKVRSDKLIKRLDKRVEAIIQNEIAEEFLTNQKKSPAKIYENIRTKCWQQDLPLPSKNAVIERIDEVHPELKAKKREGRNKALRFRPNRGSIPGMGYLNSIWQIDHTMVDIELVDSEKRIAIGRPWITVVIELFSRMIVGWYVSLDPPGTLATGIAISSAILPKAHLLADFSEGLQWVCVGKPDVIHADNAKEFRGKTLQYACNEHNIDLKYRKVKKPNYGAHIERYMGTLMTEIHALDGSTGSNPTDKGDYDSAKNATMTLDDFNNWLAHLILGKYHLKEHSGLGRPPVRQYQDGILGTDQIPGIGFVKLAGDPEKLRMDFLPFEERTIQPVGCVIDHIHYQDPVLYKWIGAADPTNKRNARKFIFRYDPRDISCLYFWDPEVYQYYRIPYRDNRRPAVSKWELNAARKWLKDRGTAEVDEDAIFGALVEMRRIEDRSKELTRQAARNRERDHQRQVALSKSPLLPPAQQAGAGSTTTPSRSRSVDLTALKPLQEIDKS